MEDAVAAVFREHDAIPLFLGYPSTVKGKPPFPAVIVPALTITSCPWHSQSPPAEGRRHRLHRHGLQDRELVGDSAVTLAIGEISPDVQKLLDVTLESLNLAIRAMARCRYWSEVASRWNATSRARAST